MHFSQGWVQFGYRFSLDFVPWALLLVAIGLERIARRGPPAWLAPVAAGRRRAGRRRRSRSTSGASSGATRWGGDGRASRAASAGRCARPGSGRSASAWIALGPAALWRLMPGLGFWDTAEFQMVLPVMGTAHPTGYPTYVLLGWLASSCS